MFLVGVVVVSEAKAAAVDPVEADLMTSWDATSTPEVAVATQVVDVEAIIKAAEEDIAVVMVAVVVV
jgi:hypothetical protein